VIDTRRYQWMVGAFGLLMVVLFSLYLYTHSRQSSPGVPAGQRLRHFVAPLATGDLNLAANVNPRCDPARPAKQGLNVCGRGPLVLEFFALDAPPCIRAVDTLQRVSAEFRGVRFAAVAAGGGEAGTRALVRSHHWRIPVAFDLTGSVGELYDVTICPMIEVSDPRGVVRGLLIGERWERPAALAGELSRLLQTAPSGPRREARAVRPARREVRTHALLHARS
jgi:hypothetical protein